MARRRALLALLPLSLATPSHALAKEGGPDDPVSEIVDSPPSGPLALSPYTIGPSNPLGYLGGRSSVDHSGDLTWSLALWAPPGRNGQEPGLGIAYSARGGDGLVGVGFALSGLPEIHRCGQSVAVDGVASGVTYGDSDRFCMSGQHAGSLT